MKIKRFASALLALVVLFAAGCSGTDVSSSLSLKASGTITITEVQVAPEISGKISEIEVADGDQTTQGEVLFKLDDQLLQAQANQANAAVQVAQADLALAQYKQASAQAQYDQASQDAREQNQPNRTSDWTTTPPDGVSLPGWYFTRSEQVFSLQALVNSDQQNLDTQQDNLNAVLKDASNQDFVSSETRLDSAEQAYNIAQTTLNDAKAASDTTDLQDAAQQDFNTASDELNSAQSAYNQVLSSDAASRVLKARAQVAVAQDMLTNAQVALDKLETGDQSLEITAAQTNLDQAKSAVAQAQASLDQAQAALDLANIQLSKTIVSSPVSGTVLSEPMNASEVAGAGSPVVVVGNLDQVTLDVYIPEDQYGRVQLGQEADVAVDSFPGKTFVGKVTYISDQAEFTPRTVQTTESRSTTVYKVELTIPNPDHDLKPGMPADATIQTP
jgi:HlyD family secretion protein